MTPDEIKALGEKVVNDTATPEEKLAFLKELNELITETRTAVAEAKKAKE